MEIKTNKEVPSSEFSQDFAQKMYNAMAVSYYKYGLVADAYPRKVNSLESLQKRLDKYMETGNTEWLVDAANFAMIEFMHPSHPHAHYSGTDQMESPGRAAYDTNFEMTQTPNADLTTKEYDEIQKRIKEENNRGLR